MACQVLSFRKHFGFFYVFRVEFGYHWCDVFKLYLIVFIIVVLLFRGWYAQRRHNFRFEHNPDFSRCAMLLNTQISGIPVLLRTYSYVLVEHTNVRLELSEMHSFPRDYEFISPIHSDQNISEIKLSF